MGYRRGDRGAVVYAWSGVATTAIAAAMFLVSGRFLLATIFFAAVAIGVGLLLWLRARSSQQRPMRTISPAAAKIMLVVFVLVLLALLTFRPE